MLYYRQISVLFSVLTLCCLLSAANAMPSPIIMDTRADKTISQDALLDRLARADVVFVGEQHTDPATHTLEMTILAGLHKRAGARLALGMEMWERDVQPALDGYLQRSNR